MSLDRISGNGTADLWLRLRVDQSFLGLIVRDRQR